MKTKNYGITDFGTWLRDFGYGTIFKMRYRDDIEAECDYIKIHNAIEIPGDILLELEFDPWDSDCGYREYEALSKIKLAYSKGDNSNEVDDGNLGGVSLQEESHSELDLEYGFYDNTLYDSTKMPQEE